MSNPQENRDEAMDRVERNADDSWKVAARDALDRIMVKMDEFTSEDVWGEIPPGYTTHEPRAMGPIMKQAIKEKSITPIGHGRSKKKGSHAYYTMIYTATYKLAKE